MKILLINSNLRSDVFAAPPIGVCCVASAAQSAGHDVSVLDLTFSRSPMQEVARAVELFEPDLVGISIRNIDNCNLLHPVSYLEFPRQIVAFLKEKTELPIVLGGSGATLCPEHVLRTLNADYIVVSEGEQPFVRLLHAIEARKPVQDIPGVGSIVHGAFQLCPPDFSTAVFVPPNAGRWLDMKPYEKMGASHDIQSKRGCNQKCIYCTYGQLIEGTQSRLRPPLEVVDEIEEIVLRYKPKCIEFVDSVFNSPLDHCGQILEEIARRPWKVQFTAMGVIPRKLDAHFLDLMWRVGFRSFMVSPESGSPKMIRTYGKAFTLDDMINTAQVLKRTRFTVMWFFLIGGPGETNDTLQETLDFTLTYLRLTKRPPYNVANYFLGIRLYPGTALWAIALKEGFFKEDANPLDQIWYVSKDLDLHMAVKQLTKAASVCPEISLGFDEKYLSHSRIGAFVGRAFRIPRPFWRHIWGLNQLMLKFGLRSFQKPEDTVRDIRQRLISQGYTGSLVTHGNLIRSETG